MPKPKKIPTRESEAEHVVYGVPRPAETPHSSKRKLPPHLNGQATQTNIPPEPSLGERLQKDLGVADEIVEPETPKADNLSILLEQGLKSSDNSLLQSVLSRSDDLLIRRTIELLPLQYTLDLIQHLGKMCAEERPRPNKSPLLWLSAVLTIRSSYLTTLPNLADALRNVYVHGDRRIKHTDRFVRLAGTISASVNLVKQRMHQKAAATSQKSDVLSYDEPLDETESEGDDTGDTDEEMPSDDETDDDSYDEDDTSPRRKIPSKAFNASSDEGSEQDVQTTKRKLNGHHKTADVMESEDDE